MTTTDTTTTASASAPDIAQTLHDLYELTAEAVSYKISTDRDERRWRVAKRTVFAGLTLAAIGACAAIYAPMLGWSSGPTQSSLAVVPIHGEIGRGSASANALVPAIERACKSKLSEAVVLRISSPGGSPTDAERIAGALAACRPSATGNGPAPKSKPVIAVIESVGASAAYLIAIQADEVISTRYSLVGSIGAVMRSVDAGEALGRFGVKERVYASGALKAGNSPWAANTPAQDALSQSLVDGIAQMFIAEVKARRGAKLKPTPDMFSGRVWVGPDALRLGLVDGNSTFEALRDSRFKSLPVHEFRPTETFQDRLGMQAVVREFGIGLSQGATGTSWQ